MSRDRACCVIILEKGKPAARLGRKAKGRRAIIVVSLAAEWMYDMQRSDASPHENETR